MSYYRGKVFGGEERMRVRATYAANNCDDLEGELYYILCDHGQG